MNLSLTHDDVLRLVSKFVKENNYSAALTVLNHTEENTATLPGLSFIHLINLLANGADKETIHDQIADMH